jgi:hypothetical protein
MFIHNKRLQYTVRVGETNPALGSLLLEQFGGPDGELAAAMRYFTQGLAEDDAGRKDMLLDIATEELSHLEVIGSIVAMLNKGVKAQLSEAAMAEAELYRSLTAGGDSHTQSILYGGGPALTNSSGVPWTAAYVDSRGDPTCDLRSNIAAESRAKIIYERLINITDDPGIKDALGIRSRSRRRSTRSRRTSRPASCRASRPSPTCTSTPRRAKATNPVPGTRASSGSGSTISPKSCRPTAAKAPRRSSSAGPRAARPRPCRSARCRTRRTIRRRGPISAPARGPA